MQSIKQTQYSLGFAFNSDRSKLVVITKNRPAWQAGKWNGIGGHIEDGENPLECLVREFHEETGVMTSEEEWNPLAVFSSPFFKVSSYYMCSEVINNAKTMTDEEVSIIPVDLNEIRVKGQTNLPWLVGLALDADINRIHINVEYTPE